MSTNQNYQLNAIYICSTYNIKKNLQNLAHVVQIFSYQVVLLPCEQRKTCCPH